MTSFSVNYGVLLLRALLEHWPESQHTPVPDEAAPGTNEETLGRLT